MEDAPMDGRKKIARRVLTPAEIVSGSDIERGVTMSGNVTSMAVTLEGEVDELGCEDRLRWDDAANDANYYHEPMTSGFFDGLAACLSALADRFELVKAEGANSAFFIRQAAEELWSLQGDARRWTSPERLPLALSLQHLAAALEIGGRKIVK